MTKTNVVTKTYIVILCPGPLWKSGKTSQEQPFCLQHSLFIERLTQEGRLWGGGDYADGSGIHLVFLAKNESEIRDWLQIDPFLLNGVTILETIKEWVLYTNFDKLIHP